MAKIFVALTLFALLAFAMGVPQFVNRPLGKGKPLVEGKDGDLQAAGSLYGGIVGGSPYGHGFSNAYPFYGRGYYSGFGYGYPYFGGYAHGFHY